MQPLSILESVLSLIILLSLFCLPARADDCAPVSLNATPMICLQQGVGIVSKEGRAQPIEKKITELADDNAFDVNKISANNSEDEQSILAGDVNLMTLHQGDLAGVEASADLTQIFQQVAEKVKSEIESFREAKRPQKIMFGAGYSLLAILGFLLALKLLNRAHEFVQKKIEQLSHYYTERAKSNLLKELASRRIVAALSGFVRLVRVVSILFMIYIFVPLVLSFFPWSARWTPVIFGLVFEPLKTVGRVILNYIPNLFYLAIIAVLTHYSLKFIRLIFGEIEAERIITRGFYKEWSEPTYKLIRIFVYALALVMAFPFLPGSSSPAFQGVSVFLGVLVSFGSSSAVSNIVSGIVLTYMRPFKIGDRVKIADSVGDVVEKNFLVTRIKTNKNVDVTVPNSMVLGSHIINYSSSSQREGLVLHTTVTIGYDAPWRVVHELLKKAALKTQLIDKEKPPFVLQTALNDFYVSYELNVYTNTANKMASIYSELHQNIQDAFNEAGVEIMSPHYSALRDGNEVTIPAEQRKAGYSAPSFRVESQSK